MTSQPKKYSYWFVHTALILITFAVFYQVLNNEFVYFDDQQYITENIYIQNLPMPQAIK